MSLRDLNWRRGCFRLWLLFSVLWAILIVILLVYPASLKFLELRRNANELECLRASIHYELIGEIGSQPQSNTSGHPAPEVLSDEEMQKLELQGKARRILPRDFQTVQTKTGQLTENSSSPSESKKPDLSKYTDEELLEIAGLKGEANAKESKTNNAWNHPYPSIKRNYEVLESNSGVKVYFDWHLTQPPGETLNYDDIFLLALGQEHIEWDATPARIEDYNYIHSGWTVPYRFERLSATETTLLSKLEKIQRLERSLASREKSEEGLLFSLSMVFCPPLSLLLCGSGFFWALSGFVSGPS